MAGVESAERVAGFPGLRFRAEVEAGDLGIVRELVRASGYFKLAEVAVAVELVAERLTKGAASGYEFLFAQADARVLGYACYGPVPATESSFDLYWIAIDPAHRGQGLGMRLLARCERAIKRADGRRIYAETSSRPQYASTHAFYRRAGFHQAALLEDFYAPGDSKSIYCKKLAPASAGDS